MTFLLDNEWTKPQKDAINIIVVGSYLKSRCHVGNILMRAPLCSRRSEFMAQGQNHRSLLCKTTKHKDTQTQVINVVVAPGLGTQYWKNALDSELIQKKYKSKIFLYVTDVRDGLLLGDDKFVIDIRKKFGTHKTWIIPIVICNDGTLSSKILNMASWFTDKAYSCHVAPSFRIEKYRGVISLHGNELIDIVLDVYKSGSWTPKEPMSIHHQRSFTAISNFTTTFGEPSVQDVPVGPKADPVTTTFGEQSVQDVPVGPKAEPVTNTFGEPSVRYVPIGPKAEPVKFDDLSLQDKRAGSDLASKSASKDLPYEQNIHTDNAAATIKTDAMVKPIQRERTTMMYTGRTHDKADKRKIVDTVKYGQAPSFHARVMVIGPNGSGKTTIIKRLKGEMMQRLHIPTEGLEINESSLRCTEDESSKCFWENECEEDLLTDRIAFAMRSKLAGEENEMIQQRSDTREVGRRQSVLSHEGAVPDASMQDRSSPCIDKSQREVFTRNTIETKNPNENNQEDHSHMSRSKTDNELRLDLTELNETTSESLSCLSDDIVKKAYIIKEHSRTKKHYFSFWDFAGQVSYYGTHQLFMTPNTINMLVVDLSKDLDGVLEENMDFAMNTFGRIKVTVKDSIEFWLQSIQMYTGKSSKCLIVVCTHIDKMIKEDIEKRTIDIQNILRSYDHIEYDLVLLDNTKHRSEDEQLDLLQRRLYEVGQKVSSREFIPVVWMEYESLLKREGKRFMTLLEVSELLLDTGSPTEDDLQRLESFLSYQHRKGMLLFFPNYKGTAQIDRTRVALDPMVIVDFLNNIMFKPKVSIESVLKEGVKGHQGFHQDGIFDETYLDGIMKGNKNTTDLANCKFEILEFLERIHVIFRYNADASWFFFMPSLLRQRGNLCTYPDATSKSSTLVIAFQPVCRHFSVFFQLVAALSHYYEVVNDRSTDRHQVSKHWYRNCACFNINESKLQKLHVRLVDNDIYIEIFNFDDDFTFGNEEEVNVCQEVKSCIQEVLREVLDLYNTVLNFELRIMCPVHCNPPIPSKILIDGLQTQQKYLCEGGSGGRHAVKRRELLKDWFHVEKQEHSDDQERTTETKGRDGRVVTEGLWCSKSKGNNVPADRDIGRICMMLHEKFIKPCCLATKLDINNCHPAVDRIVMDNKDNQSMQLLEVLFRWKRENGTNATFVKLARCLKTQSLTLATLVQVCLPVSTRRDGLPDKKLTERDLLNIADIIVASRMDFLFLELGMDKAVIENTKANTSSSSECIFKLFKKWLDWSETGSLLDLDCACRVIKMDIRATLDALSDTTEKRRLKELNAFQRR